MDPQAPEPASSPKIAPPGPPQPPAVGTAAPAATPSIMVPALGQQAAAGAQQQPGGPAPSPTASTRIAVPSVTPLVDIPVAPGVRISLSNGKPTLVFDTEESFLAFVAAQRAQQQAAAAAAASGQAPAASAGAADASGTASAVAAAAAATAAAAAAGTAAAASVPGQAGTPGAASESAPAAAAAAADSAAEGAGGPAAPKEADPDEEKPPPPATRIRLKLTKREGPHPDEGKLRGIYAASDEEDEEFRQVQTFETKTACGEWYSLQRRRTNPKYKHCDQIYTTVCDWEQACDLILKPLGRLRRTSPARPPAPLPASSRFAGSKAMLVGLRSRLRLPVHEAPTDESTVNTLRYLFFHMRCGIFVALRRGRVAMFVPFVNKDYTNNWGETLELEGNLTVDEYYRAKRQRTRLRERPIQDRRRWWANGNIMCNVESRNFWGDSYLTQLRHMLERTCDERTVSDCEFFINKRDFPHLKKDQSEPYDFLFSRDGVPLDREAWASLAPICSFFLSHEFADLPLVTTDDWETATGVVFPPVGTDLRSLRNRKRHEVAWAERRATAIFRGNSTGPGTTPATNQRLAVALLSARWSRDPRYNEKNPVDGVPFLDGGVVGWNLRDRKLQGGAMTYIKPDSLPIGLVDRVPMYKQAEYKYQLYVDGHCAAMRYASMMPLGSVILLVASVTKADHMWYFPLLKPHDRSKGDDVGDADHIVVAADLSDLAEVITWCKQHDAACEQITLNSKRLYHRLISREGQLDYMQLMIREIALKFMPHAAIAAEMGAPGARQALEAAQRAEEEAAASRGATSTSSSSSSSSAAAAAAAAGQAASVSGTSTGSSGTSIKSGAVEQEAGAEMLEACGGSGSADPVGDGAGGWGEPLQDWFGADNTAYVSARVAAAAIPRPRLEDRLPKHQASSQSSSSSSSSGAAPAKRTVVVAADTVSVSARDVARKKREQAEELRRRLLKRGAGSLGKGLAAAAKAAIAAAKARQGTAPGKRPRDAP